eukprot:gene5129-250_t
MEVDKIMIDVFDYDHDDLHDADRFLVAIRQGALSNARLYFRFALTPPSMIAAAAICVAFHGLNKSIGLVCPTRQELLSMMHDITGAEEEYLSQCQVLMEDVLNLNKNNNNNEEVNQGDQPITPSDIRDVHF